MEISSIYIYIYIYIRRIINKYIIMCTQENNCVCALVKYMFFIYLYPYALVSKLYIQFFNIATACK